MQAAMILLALMVILFVAAACLPAFAGIFVLAGLGVGFFAFLVGISLLGKK